MQTDIFDLNSFECRLSAKNQFDGNLKYGAADFHKTTNRSGEGKPASGSLVREHARVVLDTKNERYQRLGDYWEEVAFCPVCGSRQSSFLLSRQGLDIWSCSDCSHCYQNPRISFAKACELYSDDKTAADIYTQPIQKEIDRVKYQYGLNLIEHLGVPAKDRLMDIGCGAGVFLEVASERGWKNCVGVDANSRYGTYYRPHLHLQYINSSFEKLEPSVLGKDYDCITLWNVLEHLYDLHSIVASIKNILKPGGLVFIMVPNVKSLATRLIRDKSPTFNWKHVSHFSARSLEVLMQHHALKQVHLETAITEIDNIKSYMSGEYPYEGYGDPAALFEFITPDYIHRNMLGSRLIGVFKRE